MNKIQKNIRKFENDLNRMLAQIGVEKSLKNEEELIRIDLNICTKHISPNRSGHEKEAEAVWEKHEQEKAKAQVAKCEACAKTLVPVGEPIVALGLDSESGVSILGVTDLVSNVCYFYFFDLNWLVGPFEGEILLHGLYQET